MTCTAIIRVFANFEIVEKKRKKSRTARREKRGEKYFRLNLERCFERLQR